jgi:hypothetical protein
MAQTKYTYSITTDTANALLAADALKEEIGSSSIVTALDYITSLGDVLDIYMKDALSTGDKTTLDGVVSAHTGVPLAGEASKVEVDSSPPFASKKIIVNGVEKSLFKRVHGVSASIGSSTTVDIDFTVPYPVAKFTGAEIFNTDNGDTLDFTVHDDASNTYSGAPTSSPGYPNYLLNQFGFDVCMPSDRYKNTSNYDADLYQNMIVRCSYTNNTGSTKTVCMNVWLHEVKD